MYVYVLCLYCLQNHVYNVKVGVISREMCIWLELNVYTYSNQLVIVGSPKAESSPKLVPDTPQYYTCLRL